MDLGAAVVTLVVGAVAVLPRIPSLSVDGRRVARLKADAELAATLPPGPARVALEEHLEMATRELLDSRGRPPSFEQRLSIAMLPMLVAWVSGALADGLPRGQRWLESLVVPLQLTAVVFALASVALCAVLVLQALRQAAALGLARWRRLRASRRSDAGATSPA